MQKEVVTKLVFVRHGESEKNVLEIKSSTVDKWPLTENGRRHAQNVADRLKKMGRFDLIMSSPVLRARQTAEIISAKLDLSIVFEDLLREYEYGRWNDLTKAELMKNHADYREFKQHEKGSVGHFNFKLGGAESRADAVERIRIFIQKIKKNYRGKNIILVSHGGINGAIEKVLNDISTETYYQREQIGHEEIETYYIAT